MNDKNYSNLKLFQDIHKGERCFIIATGPSLTYDDLDKLKNEKTFGMNSLAMAVHKTQWRPTYYGIQDVNVYQKLERHIIDARFQQLFIGDLIAKRFDLPANSNPYPVHYLNHRYGYGEQYQTRFSDNIYSIVYDGFSITYSLIQIAAFMGFKEIYLLGCDCNYPDDKNKQHFIESGHYDPTYKTAGERMIAAYKVAKEYADQHGIKIYNATRGGKLEVFPRVDLDEILDIKDTQVTT